MKILTLHSDYIKVEPKKKAIRDAEQLKEKEIDFNECLVVFSAVEKDDNIDIVGQYVDNIIDVSKQVKTKNIMLYPYVHLTNQPSSPEIALNVLKKAEEILKKKGYNVKRAPFGWYKAFEIKVKGHPLSELSRTIKYEKQEKEDVNEDEGEISEIKVILVDGSIKDRKDVKDKKIIKAIKSELKEVKESHGEPPHIKLMRRLAISKPEPRVSDAGNLRYYPKGIFILNLIMDLGRYICTQKLNGVEVRTPYIINPEQREVKIMMSKFPERLYRVLPGLKTKNQEFRLRPACDYGVWSMFKDMTITYKQLPFGIYEHDLIWRYEQRGELLGMYRIRNATMADLHTMCKDINQAFDEFKRQVKEFAINLYYYFDIEPSLVVLNCKKDFFDKHKDTFKEWAKSFNIPIVVKLFKSMKTYKVAWVDVMAFDKLDRPMEVDTVQLDTESSKWWDITYVDDDGTKKHPLILHTGFGAERLLAAILEDASGYEKPILPLWISPTQVRVLPVSEKYVDDAMKIVDELNKDKIRADIDDRNLKLNKKILEAEQEWIPYVVIFGEKELKGDLSVRLRKEGKNVGMKLDELKKVIKDKTKDMPYRDLPLNKRLSMRPSFI